MNEPLRIALVGAGGIGKIWASAFKKISSVVLRCVIDVNEQSAKDIAAQFDGCVHGTKWEDVVQQNDIDAVVVATPHNLLASVSKGFLEAGKHVLCEKPGAVDVLSLIRNTELAAKKKLVYMIGFNHRFHAAFAEAKRRLVAGEVGEAMFIRARHGFGGRPGYEKEWRLQKAVSGGGELIDQGVHMIDLARWFLGDFADVKGFAEKMYWKSDVEDNGFALLRTNDHKVAQIHVSWTQWDWIHSFEIMCTNGYLLIEGLDGRYRGPEKLVIGKHDPQSGQFPKEETIVYKDEKKEDSFARELAAFSDGVSGKDADIPRGGDAIATLSIVETIYSEL